MLYELRSYDIDPERIDGYLEWANNRAMPILIGQFGFRVKGFWHAIETSEGPAPETNVHWIIAWDWTRRTKARSLRRRGVPSPEGFVGAASSRTHDADFG